MGDGKLAELLLQGIAEGHITAYRGFAPGFGTSPSFHQPRTPDSLLLIPNVPEHMAPMMFSKESLSLGLGRLQQGGGASLQCFVLGVEGRFDPTGVTRTIAFLKPDEVLAFLAAKNQGPLADAIQQMSTDWLEFTARDPQMHLYEVGHPGSGQAARPFEQGTLEGIDMAEGAVEALKALYRALP
jgi:hypothetical protein